MDILVIIYLLYLVFNKKIYFSTISLIPIFLGFIALASYLINSNNYIYYSIPIGQILRWFFFAILIIVYTGLINNRKKVWSCLVGLLVGSIITLSWSWYVWFLMPNYLFGLPFLHVYENTEFVINRNFMGFFLAIGTSLSFGFSIMPKLTYKKRILFILIFIWHIFSLVLTFSKGAWLSGIAPIIYISIFILYKKYKYRLFFLIPFSLLLLTIISSTFTLQMINNLDMAIKYRLTKSEYTNTMRTNYIYDSITLIIQNPIFGVGPKAYRHATIKDGLQNTSDPHNALLWVGAELGFISLLSLLLIMILVFKYLKSNRFKLIIFDYHVIFQLVFFSLLLHTIVSGLAFSMKVTWILIGLVSGVLFNKSFYYYPNKYLYS
jgi:O-antigen ligase